MTELELLDWKRRIFALYSRVRETTDHETAWKEWVATRDELFRGHSQSPLPADERVGFSGLGYFPFDPDVRVEAKLTQASAQSFELTTSGSETMAFTRFATAAFRLYGSECTLDVYWLDAYGGGIFVPYKDATSGHETYGAGRYLFDTVKGADLGSTQDGLIFDFNFAYNPSCAYDPRWVCPLAPPPNHLELEVRAGELS
ncbi:MAG TPA: DUF1684 domain-containing protein [Actinomycetota bacterium]|nr:DUF1684 domain-containing protein [Actinomycetota bacterium]